MFWAKHVSLVHARCRVATGHVYRVWSQVIEEPYYLQASASAWY